MSEASDATPQAMNTRSGRKITRPSRLIEESGGVMPDLGSLSEYEIHLTRAEEKYYKMMMALQEKEFVSEEE